MDCSPPGCSVHGISQARLLEWVAISFSRGSSGPRDQTHVSCSSRQILYHWVTREAQRMTWESINYLTCCETASVMRGGLGTVPEFSGSASIALYPASSGFYLSSPLEVLPGCWGWLRTKSFGLMVQRSHRWMDGEWSAWRYALATFRQPQLANSDLTRVSGLEVKGSRNTWGLLVSGSSFISRLGETA